MRLGTLHLYTVALLWIPYFPKGVAHVGSMDHPSISQADEEMQASPSMQVPDMPSRLYFPESVIIRAHKFHSAIESGLVDADEWALASV